jgi:hypothetical protein
LAERLRQLKDIGAILKLQQTIRGALIGSQECRAAEEATVNMASFEQ